MTSISIGCEAGGAMANADSFYDAAKNGILGLDLQTSADHLGKATFIETYHQSFLADLETDAAFHSPGASEAREGIRSVHASHRRG